MSCFDTWAGYRPWVGRFLQREASFRCKRSLGFKPAPCSDQTFLQVHTKTRSTQGERKGALEVVLKACPEEIVSAVFPARLLGLIRGSCGLMGRRRLWLLSPGGGSGNLQNSTHKATRGICAFIEQRQSTTCFHAEKRARHLSALARLIKGRWLTTRTGLCHLPLFLGQVFRKSANHHTCA